MLSLSIKKVIVILGITGSFAIYLHKSKNKTTLSLYICILIQNKI